jgi:hypothetical protein
VDPRHLLTGTEGLLDNRARARVLQLRPDERPALAGLDVLELDDLLDLTVELDVHPVLELRSGDRLGHERRL